MKEARIECLVKEFPLHDFGLRLKQGESVWKPEAVARASRELAEACHMGAVSVQYKERCRESKPVPPRRRRIVRKAPPTGPLKGPEIAESVKEALTEVLGVVPPKPETKPKPRSRRRAPRKKAPPKTDS